MTNTTIMTNTTFIIISLLLLGNSSAFVPRVLRADARTIQTASAPPRAPEVDLAIVGDETRTTRLELDTEQGCLRQGPRVLLNGLNPSIWSSTTVVPGDDTSLFLHTRHAKERSQFEYTVGDLISCQRLLACARK